MNEFFFEPLRGAAFYKDCMKVFNTKNADVNLSGVSASTKSHLICLFTMGNEEKRSVYIAANDYAARKAYEEINYFTNGAAVLLEPTEYMLYDVEARSGEANFKRMSAIERLTDGNWNVAVMSSTAAAQWMPDPEIIKKTAITVSVGDNYEPFSIADKLVNIGYTRVLRVDGKGQFALRGDIVDVFSSNFDNPIRIEFFDNEIDCIKIFDVLTQRSIEQTETVRILPDKETYIQDDYTEILVREKIDKALETAVSEFESKNRSDLARRIKNKINSDMEKFGPNLPGYDRYIPFIIGQKHTVFDYTGNVPVFIDDDAAINESLRMIIDDHVRMCETIDEKSGILHETYYMYMDAITLNSIIKKNARSIFRMQMFGAGQNTINVPVKSVQNFSSDMEAMIRQLNEWKSKKYITVIAVSSTGKAERMKELLGNAGLQGILPKENEKPVKGAIYLVGGAVGEGFEYPSCEFAVISDSVFFKKEGKKSKSKLHGKMISSFADIKPGDYVVHEAHGIGQFMGVESILADGTRRDYIKIKYKDDGALYVPAYQLETVQKYIGSEGHAPKINKLGGSEWNKLTAKVKDSLREYAAELVSVYARRSKIKGHAYSPDTVWQKEFEDGFEFDETDDQLKCTEEIKKDMEATIPMERLLCGDVGYGKTEVALRAAFKAVCDGKQVAFLVPTTILAQQHYKNFVKRFTDFPVKVDYLCRFRTATERQKIIKNLKKGDIDILVGTHSVIQDKIEFADLGLVVVDEEQRFGVMHKEKLKIQHPNVDILTLSATPIPRTLHMSLTGIRDISLLEEPPVDRYPVQTYVSEWNPDIIKNAIYREMGRKGQIFYLYNKVKTITEKKMAISSLVPEARVAVAHGQMGERELEDTMEAFLKGDYDVLLCTTIIESGLDMPNVNTIIVEEGDHLGLAQLYQIRGRVGRSNKKAYAYVTYKRDKALTEIAEKRLQTIKDFTEFGSGFKIAMRDLELRGAGSVLGERQHGQLAVVGYEMYCKLLGEVVSESQGIIPEESKDVTVDVRVNAFVGSDYIEDEESRLDIYRKIANIKTTDDILEITDELIDRYGDVPFEVNNLMKVSYIRYLAGEAGFEKVSQKDTQVVFIFKPGISINAISYMGNIMDTFKGRVLLNAGGDPYLALLIKNQDNEQVLNDIVNFTEKCNVKV